MNSFSIAPYEHQQILDAYKQWLVRDLYQNNYIDNLNDPNFLQKLSLLQAEGIRHDIGLHAAVTHHSISEASSQVGRKIQSVASLITSSLDKGFTLMNQRMCEVNDTLHIVNANIIEGNRLQARTNQEIQSLNKNMVVALSAINANISQATNFLRYQLQQVSTILQTILDELKIPESQRERRYHIEEGIKYFNMGMKTGDCLYFEDALDEFNTAVSTEKKDFFSWYYIGMIHLYSHNHIDIEKAISAFDRYFHYAAALPVRHELFDEALLMKAECFYLNNNINEAFLTIEYILSNSIRATLRGVKYLSATGITDKQIMAVSIFKGLVEKNPYVFMQVLEDCDIVNNEYIISFIKEYCEKTKDEIKGMLAVFNQELEKLNQYPASYTKEIYEEVNSLLSLVNKKIIGIGVVDAIALKEELKTNGLVQKIHEAGITAQRKVAADKRRKEVEKKKISESRAYLKAHGYVDLGLPSGTVWKSENERGFYERRNRGQIMNLPSSNQWRELLDKCNWSWSWFRGGFKIVGPNGASIFLPASGIFELDDGKSTIYSRGSQGEYLSSTETQIKDDEGNYVTRLFVLYICKKSAQLLKRDHGYGKCLVRLAY